MEDSLDILQHQIKQQKKKAAHAAPLLDSIEQTTQKQHKNATQSAHNNNHKGHKENQMMDSLQIHQKKNEHIENEQNTERKNTIKKEIQVQQQQKAIKKSEHLAMSSSLLSADMQHLNKTPFFANQNQAMKQLHTDQAKSKKKLQAQLTHYKQQKIMLQVQQDNQFIHYPKNQHNQIKSSKEFENLHKNLQKENTQQKKQDHYEQVKHNQKQPKHEARDQTVHQDKKNIASHKNVEIKQNHNNNQINKIPTKQQNKNPKISNQGFGFTNIFQIVYTKTVNARLDLIYNITKINLNDNSHQPQQQKTQKVEKIQKQIQIQKQKIISRTKQHHQNNQQLKQHQGSSKSDRQIKTKQHSQKVNQLTEINHITDNLQNIQVKTQANPKIIQRKSQEPVVSEIKNSKPLTPLKQSSEGSNDKKNEKINSGIIQQRMSSAQSQRIKSAISRKSSEGGNDQSFRLDLTAKSKFSKHLNKMDSLLYSAQSGFGYNPSSPKKANRLNQHASSNKTVLKMDQIADLQQNNHVNQSEPQNSNRLIHRSYSQKVQFQKPNRKYERIMSTKQKIQQHHEHQADEHQGKQMPNFQNEPAEYNHYFEDQQQSYKYNEENGQHMQNFFKSPHTNNQKLKQNDSNHNINQNDHHNNHDQHHHQHKDQKQLHGSMQNQFEIQGPSTLNYDDYQLKEPSSNLQISSQKNLSKHNNQEEDKDLSQDKEFSNQQNDDIYQIKNGKIQKVHKQKSPNKIKQKATDKYQKVESVPIKSKYRSSEDYKNQNSSIIDGTLIDKVQNFDADDQQGQDFEKQMTQSAHLGKKRSQKIIAKKRVGTQIGPLHKQANFSKRSGPKFNLIDLQQQQSHGNSRAVSIKSHKSHQNSNTNIFSTQINTYQNKIAKIKQEKQMRKKKLQEELAKINNQIKILNKKEQQMSPNSKNNYISRVQISDNNEAQKKAQSLVKNLRSQKRNRNIAKLGQFKNIDKNINEYMEELSKLRQQNQQKVKQKKKIQILERMKQNEMRKLNDRKKIQQNQQFVIQLKSPGQTNKLSQIQNQNENKKRHSDQINIELRQQENQNQLLQSEIKQLTPSLYQKKAQLKKVRGLSVRKNQDKYQQLLG